MNSFSRSIAQTIVPAVRRAASTAAPAAAQTAKEGFKLVEVRFELKYSAHAPLHTDFTLHFFFAPDWFPLQVLYAVPPLLAIVGYGGTVCFHETGALRRIRRSFAEVPH